MTLRELIKQLLTEASLDAAGLDLPVFIAGGEYEGDWRPLISTSNHETNTLAKSEGIYLE